MNKLKCEDKKKNYNIKVNFYGLSLLRVILAFDVINCHCFKKKTTSNKLILYLLDSNRLHVPLFIIMSFYFTHNDLLSLNFDKIYKRFERLFIPYIGWPLILFLLSNFINYFNKSIPLITFKNLFCQIILGDSPNIPLHFWFLFDLIITTKMFLFIIITNKNHYSFTLLSLMLLSYYFQYSKINLNFYYSNRQPSLGKEMEFIPFAVTGFIICELNIIDKTKNYKIKTFIISFIIYKLIQFFEIFARFKGVQYNGIKLNVCSTCIILIFSLVSIQKDNKYIKLINILTNFTGGIYYIHRIVEKYFQFLFYDIKKGTFCGIILIYLFSYIICFTGTLMSRNTKAKYIFC